jgi:hypothetical protein
VCWPARLGSVIVPVASACKVCVTNAGAVTGSLLSSRGPGWEKKMLKEHAIQHVNMLRSERYVKNKSQYNFSKNIFEGQSEYVYHYSLNDDSGARILPSV